MAHTPADSDVAVPCQGALTSASTGVLGWEEQPGLETLNLPVIAWLLRAGREGDSRQKSAIDKSLPQPSPHIHKDGPSQVFGMAGLKVGRGLSHSLVWFCRVSGKASSARGETWVNNPSP